MFFILLYFICLQLNTEDSLKAIGITPMNRGKKMPKSNSKKKATKYQNKVKSVMGEFKSGSLHSGKGGPVVKSKKQAIAIAISQASKIKKK